MSPRYAVIVSRFPKFTETFVLQELIGMEERGLPIELFTVTHESPEQLQPTAADFDSRAHYLHARDRAVWAAQWYWIRRSPATYLRTFWLALRTSFPSRAALLRAPWLVVLAAAMARRMADLDVDRVHAHWATYPTMCALCIEELSGIPFSFTGHAHDIQVDRVGLGTKVRRADAVLTCTDHGRHTLVDAGGGEVAVGSKVHLIHHGTCLGDFEATPLPERSPGDPLRVICVAALVEYKGHRHLLDACAELGRRGRAVQLTLLGEGELRPELTQQARSLGLDVTFLGRQPSDVVRAEVANADCFALASIELDTGKMDGIPNVCVEAMAMGRPVIAASLPGMRELISHTETGLLATSGDASSMADQLERVITDRPLVTSIVTAARSKVEAEHDAHRNLDEVFRILSGLGLPADGSR